jgi:hypothetical protein
MAKLKEMLSFIIKMGLSIMGRLIMVKKMV